MTHRYLESLAARCIVLGEPVPELVQLMGYDPVIEVDPSDPTGQLTEILAKPDKYQGWVDEAHARLQAVGDWACRVQELHAIVTAHFVE
jgi:hypothetical protein